MMQERTANTPGSFPRQPFPFFLGCGRSGTTLVRAIFDSHPMMAIPASTLFVLTMAAWRDRYEDPAGIRVEPFLHDLGRLTDISVRWGISEGALRRELTEVAPTTYTDAVRCMFAMYARSRNKPRYGNKTPLHVLRLGTLAELFPEARFVHIVRDGRDVALSFRDQNFGPSTIAAGAIHWRHHVTAGRTAGARYPDRYMEMRYENLVADPEATLRPVCAFLDLDFDEAMLSYTERADELTQRVGSPEAHQRLRLAPSKSLRSWRDQMTTRDVSRFEALAGDLLSELGYERGAPEVSVGARFAAGAVVMMEQARRTSAAVARRVVLRRDIRVAAVADGDDAESIE